MNVVAREIVPDAWPQFLDQVTREHRGHRFDVRVSAPDVGLQSDSTRLTLLGITAEESREGIDPVIRVCGGDPRQGQVTHVIAAPAHLRALGGIGGGSRLEIESTHGSTVRIDFETQAPTTEPP
jgi:hypothetical protein